jgi:hypothetical protein
MTTPCYDPVRLADFIQYLHKLDPSTIIFAEVRAFGESLDRPVNMNTVFYCPDGWWNPVTGDYATDDKHVKEEMEYAVRTKDLPNAGYEKCPILYIRSQE